MPSYSMQQCCTHHQRKAAVSKDMKYGLNWQFVEGDGGCVDDSKDCPTKLALLGKALLVRDYKQGLLQ